MLALHKKGLSAWYQQDWQEAAEIFRQLLASNPQDFYYASMLEKIDDNQRDTRSMPDPE